MARAEGLEPGSALLIGDESGESATYVVDEHGSWDPDGFGFLYFVAGTPITFTADAIDGDGSDLVGEITVTTTE